MPSFSGQFELQTSAGSTEQRGACQITFDHETFTLTPVSGPPLAIDLGDIDIFTPGEFDLTLKLYTGQRLLLRQFGRAFQNLSHDLLEAYRKRLVECLLLEDLEESARFEGHAQMDSKTAPDRSFSSPAEIRLCRSNLALLPTQATSMQWRLAEIDSVTFDEQTYAITLQSGPDTITLTRLAKRTREFHERLESGITAIREKAAQVLHRLLPFLTPDEFQKAATLMREGQPASFGNLNSVNTKIERALCANIVDPQLKPYCDALGGLGPAGGAYTGFKFIREEEEESPAAEESSASIPESGETIMAEESPAPETLVVDENQEPVLHWFFFPLSPRGGGAPKLVAWEAASRGGRATYFFRVVPPEQSGLAADGTESLDAAIAQLNRALVLLNFRREPIYLSSEKLETDPRYRRYAIASRKLPELRRLRSNFVGRAIHTSLDAWRKQVEGFLGQV